MNKIQIPKNEYRISITSACNMKCVYCHNEGNKEFASLSLQDIDLLLASSENVDLKSVRLTGGEPTIHPDFIEICRLIKEKYGLQLGVNTNAMNISKMMPLLQAGYIDRIVVGVDYFDGEVSKNSPVGAPSRQVLDNVLSMKQYCDNVCIATVYSDNFEDIDKLTEICIKHGIRIKILEVVENQFAENTTKKYSDLRKYIAEKYDLELKSGSEYFTQQQGFKDGKRVVSFYHSLHRLHNCEQCKKVNLRISAKGEFRNCLMGGIKSSDYRVGNAKENIEKALTSLLNLDCDPGRQK